MKIVLSRSSGLTLVEVSVTSVLIGVLGLIIFSLLNIGTILGAKNTATNTAHQQARVAMLRMVEDIHSAVSLPRLQGIGGSSGSQTGSGISFQKWGAAPLNGVMTTNGGPHKIVQDVDSGDDTIVIKVSPRQPRPIVGQRLVVPTHQIEDDIIDVSGGSGNLNIKLANNVRVGIKGTDSTVGDIVCYIMDRYSYNVVQVSPGPPAQYKLQMTNTQGTRDIVNDVTNPQPFSVPTTLAGAPYHRFVAAIDLSTADPNYTNRGYKSANILLNGQVPFRVRLTTYQ